MALERREKRERVTKSVTNIVFHIVLDYNVMIKINLICIQQHFIGNLLG